MSDTRRIIPVSLDVETSSRRVVVGSSLELPDSAQVQHLYYGTQLLFRATLYSGSIAVPYMPPADATWLFGIDDRFDADHPDLVVSLNDQFNIAADWDALDIVNGKICFRADLATAELKAALALIASGVETKTMYAYVWMTPAAGHKVLVAKWDLTMHRVAVDPVTASAVPGITHITSDVLTAVLADLKAPSSGLYRIRNGALQLKHSSYATFHTLSISGEPGSETLDIGPGES